MSDQEPAAVELPPPTNVIEALARCTAEIGGIEKRRRLTEPGERDTLKFPFRGIDAIASAAQPLLGRYGVVIVPTEAKITTIENITLGGNPWTDTFVTVLWTVYGPGGLDDSFESITQGIGRDNSDKGYNKGATQAFKNLLLRLLCIGDPKDDADEHQNNVNEVQPRVETEEDLAAVKSDTDDLIQSIKAASDNVRAELKTWSKGRSMGGNELYRFDDWRQMVRDKLTALIALESPTPVGPLAAALAEVDQEVDPNADAPHADEFEVGDAEQPIEAAPADDGPVPDAIVPDEPDADPLAVTEDGQRPKVGSRGRREPIADRADKAGLK